MQNNIKNNLRSKIIKLRDSLNYTECIKNSFNICNKIKNMPEYQHANYIGIYFANKNEVNLRDLWFQNYKKKFFAPKIIDNKIKMLQFNGEDDLSLGKFNILEPSGNITPDGKLDILFVPGVAFDLSLNRIGMGGGYYDKLLTTNPAKLIIGVAHDIQIVEKVPYDTWDQKVDRIITCNIG